jgi:very-short-patch-repair endonuclease
MNVAVTRPRRRALCFVSHSLENFPPGLVRDFLRHAANPAVSTLNGDPWDSRFEQDVHAFIKSKGLEVRPQVRACGYKLDFVLRGPRRIAALEADGWEIHYPDGRLREGDIQRQRVLERAGWMVFRVHSRAFYRDPESALAHVFDYFAIDEVLEGRGETISDVGETLDMGQSTEGAVEIAEATKEHERVDPARIPLPKLQETLLTVAPEPGVEVRRDELFHRALQLVGRERLTKPLRERFQSALSGLIRRREFGYRGRDVAWRLRLDTEINGDADVSPAHEA